MFDSFEKILMPLQRRIFLLIGRALLTTVSNTKQTQLMQVKCLKDETITDVERLQEYGFESYPKTDAETVLFFPNGNRDNGFILCVDDRRYRPTDLLEGEVCMYNSDDIRITMKTGKIISIKAKTPGRVEISAGGTLEWAALASKIKTQIDTLIDLYNAHQHGGVMGGLANTGAPTIPATKPTQSSYSSTEVKIS